LTAIFANDLLLKMELRSVNPEANRHRRYALTTQLRIDGGGDIIVRWGRIGCRLRCRVERFASSSELERRYDELLARRRRHGYVVFRMAANDVSDLDVPPAGPALDTLTRYLPLRQSNGYAGVFDAHLETFVVRNADLEVVVPLARAWNLDPGAARALLRAC
jgi:predicted DNA-binding WGR domain protein